MELRIKNGTSVALSEIPILEYTDFYSKVIRMLETTACHCVAYYAVPLADELLFICVIADDVRHDLVVLGHIQSRKKTNLELESISAKVFAMHGFEREISENLGVTFLHHPWPKPIRWSHNRADQSKTVNNYPFFHLEGSETHEVGVGPIHAGVIEPGHFRFSCYGEEVKHLEIHLGYQHRGVESTFLSKKKLIQRTVLAESIVGDCVVGHALTFAHAFESLYQIPVSERTQLSRAIALELERIAIHVGDLSAFCADIAYQLGSSVFGALRTPIINYFQLWCGNRFAKGLIRVGYSPYILTDELMDKLDVMLESFEKRYLEMANKTFSLASVMNRFDKTGVVTLKQAESIGAVGMAARASGLKRDIRLSHPIGSYENNAINTNIQKTGDVYARGKLRDLEIRTSLLYLRRLLQTIRKNSFLQESPIREIPMDKGISKWTIALTESWRGEVVHCALTDEKGELLHYKVKDPSFHNWMALALAVRNNEISDFPICNKSYSLSYCGYDL